MAAHLTKKVTLGAVKQKYRMPKHKCLCWSLQKVGRYYLRGCGQFPSLAPPDVNHLAKKWEAVNLDLSDLASFSAGIA